MFIKNIIISGFRSYREQSFRDGLSPGTNILVGKNGSGKSNFFNAVQFVLDERYANLRASERKELFHVGSGRPSLSIFVEIVFDNSSGRLMIPGRNLETEVCIRRTVGLKQDEFRVNDRKFSAEEVHRLLESSGLSSSNPYYIVEQGKIVSLANMSEENRYLIIKDVAGTKVYEARRKESETILRETEGKQKLIDESIAELEQRLKDLENETAELKEFQSTDYERKCIEYCIFSAELESSKESLRKIEEEWDNQAQLLNDNQAAEATIEQDAAKHHQTIADLNASIARLEAEKKSLQEDINALNQRQAVMELDVSHAAGRVNRNDREHALLVQEQKQLKEKLASERVSATEKRRRVTIAEMDAKRRFDKLAGDEKKLLRMQEKRNRMKLYKSKAERDHWISQEILSNKEAIAKAKDEIVMLQQSCSNIDEKIGVEERQLKEQKVASSGVENKLSTHESKVAIVLEKRNELNRSRRKIWQEIHEQENVVHKLEEQLKRTRHQLERSVRHDIRQGLQSLQELLSDRGNAGIRSAVHGPLIDLIGIQKGYETAAEITAGNTLFHVVVDTFDVSARLLEEMNRCRKPGRISFFPLDMCKPNQRSIPDSANCTPLISKITVDDKFRPVCLEVFGRTAVVPTLEAGARIVKEARCDVVTIDGDQLSSKGGITGGYIDRGHMKLPVYISEKEVARILHEERSKLDGQCQQVATVEQHITEILNELEALRNQNYSEEKNADANLREVRASEDRINRLRAQKENLLSVKRTHERCISDGEELIGQLQLDLKEQFKTTWTTEEENRLEELIAETTSNKTFSLSAQSEVLQLATEAQLIEDTVQHLEKRISIVDDRIRELGWSKHSARGIGQEQATIETEQASLNQRLSALEKTIEKESIERQKREAQVESISGKRLRASMDLQERKHFADKIQIQRNLLIQRRDDALQKMRGLGVVPQGSNAYASFSLGKLMHQLKQVNERLKTFSHVNRKALDQHATLLETKNDLVTKREALGTELGSIKELMDHLDRKKEEAIERTYKQIQLHFEEVFKELVGDEGSLAELLLVKPISGEEPYSAARIRVSFGVGAAVSELEQLSGGQKSLVALALIFAIQRCDPAPFYLFDEIDAALDGEYRAAVASVIQKQSTDCQFIIASFKTEMLFIADNVLGIFFQNKVSKIQKITADEGVQLLKQAAEDRKRSREAEGEDD